MTAPDLPPVQPLGPVPGTGDRPGPNVWPLTTEATTVTITPVEKPCGCGVLLGEYCDCAEFMLGLGFMEPVYLPPHLPGLAPLTDRALGGAA